MNSAIIKYGKDIVLSERFRRGKNVPHHRNITVAEHSIAVAETGYAWAQKLKRLGVRVDEADVVRSALLHDIGMTEVAVHEQIPARKCFLHPKVGAQIAAREYHASKVQCQAVRRHMWPAGVIPPTNLTGWIIWAVDNHCALKELLHKT